MMGYIGKLFIFNYIFTLIDVYVTNPLHGNDKFIPVQNKCLKIPPSASMHFAVRVRRSLVVRLS